MEFTDKFLQKKSKLAVVGLGYVGLPVALEYGKIIQVIGYDKSKLVIDQLSKGIDPGAEWPADAFNDTDIFFTHDEKYLRDASFYIVAVPTPIDRNNIPDLSYLLDATKKVASNLRKGDYVVYESTVYPGATEEECIPILESVSGLKVGKDFKVGYSPERINPGDKLHLLTTVTKVVSGCDDEALKNIAAFYKLIVKADVFEASRIKVAEAAKIIENTQRDVNIALMNELSMIFNKMDINTFEVLEAAGTKWNFLHFFPGLVGGHCIGVDPYYLAYKAQELRHHPQIINSGRAVNDSMGYYIAKQTIKKLVNAGKRIRESRVLLMGVTFKENVSDIRNSKVMDIVEELRSYGISVEVTDPLASIDQVKKEYGEEMISEVGKEYDAVIIAVAHNKYKDLRKEFFTSVLSEQGILVDVKGIYLKKFDFPNYWTL